MFNRVVWYIVYMSTRNKRISVEFLIALAEHGFAFCLKFEFTCLFTSSLTISITSDSMFRCLMICIHTPPSSHHKALKASTISFHVLATQTTVPDNTLSLHLWPDSHWHHLLASLAHLQRLFNHLHPPYPLPSPAMLKAAAMPDGGKENAKLECAAIDLLSKG